MKEKVRHSHFLIGLLVAMELLAACTEPTPGFTAIPSPTPTPVPLPSPTYTLTSWPVYILQDADLTVRYPPDWAVHESTNYSPLDPVVRSVSFVPPRYAESDSPQVPHISLAIYRQPLEAHVLFPWLDEHSTADPFGSLASPAVYFFGVNMNSVLETKASGLPALRFLHDMFGFTAHGLLLATGKTVVGLSYVDFGVEDLEPTFLRMQESLTPTTVDPPPGLIYRTADGLWQVGADGQSVRLFDRPDAILSPDGTQALYISEGDIWLADLNSGEQRNLTETPDREEHTPIWWPAQPKAILCASWPLHTDGHAWGFLTTVQTDGRGYRVLEEKVSYGPPAPSPDGQTIAYDKEGTAWLYRWDTGPEPFALAKYGVTNENLGIASPAWSPDGRRLAWVVKGTLGEGWPRSRGLGIGMFEPKKQRVWLLHSYEPVGIGGWPEAPTWSPNGRWLVFFAHAQNPAEAGLWLVRFLADAYPTRFLGECSGPVWSPDGSRLALSHSKPPAERVVWLVGMVSLRVQQVNLPLGVEVVAWREVDSP